MLTKSLVKDSSVAVHRCSSRSFRSFPFRRCGRRNYSFLLQVREIIRINRPSGVCRPGNKRANFSAFYGAPRHCGSQSVPSPSLVGWLRSHTTPHLHLLIRGPDSSKYHSRLIALRSWSPPCVVLLLPPGVISKEYSSSSMDVGHRREECPRRPTHAAIVLRRFSTLWW